MAGWEGEVAELGKGKGRPAPTGGGKRCPRNLPAPPRPGWWSLSIEIGGGETHPRIAPIDEQAIDPTASITMAVWGSWFLCSQSV